MVNMICDNCGANIDKNEEYCPNCGMELLTPTPKKNRYPKKPTNPRREKSKPSDDEEIFSHSNPHSIEKPIKEKYIGYSEPESQDYSQYYDRDDYEDTEPYNETEEYETPKEKGSGIGTIVLLLFIALVFGFIVGLLIFSSSSQHIPQIPGFST